MQQGFSCCTHVSTTRLYFRESFYFAKYFAHFPWALLSAWGSNSVRGLDYLLRASVTCTDILCKTMSLLK